MLKDLQKFVKVHHVLALVGLVLLAAVVMQYSRRKGSVLDSMAAKRAIDRQGSAMANSGGSSSGSVSPSNPAGQNEVFSPVSGMAGPQGFGLPPSCSRQPVVNPEDLLPKDTNSQWAQLNPRGSGDLNNVNLLQAGYLYGINTVGSSLRNANLQVRSEPPNPQVQVSPWLNTTIEPDLMRTPLELGCGPQ